MKFFLPILTLFIFFSCSSGGEKQKEWNVQYKFTVFIIAKEEANFLDPGFQPSTSGIEGQNTEYAKHIEKYIELKGDSILARIVVENFKLNQEAYKVDFITVEEPASAYEFRIFADKDEKCEEILLAFIDSIQIGLKDELDLPIMKFKERLEQRKEFITRSLDSMQNIENLTKEQKLDMLNLEKFYTHILESEMKAEIQLAGRKPLFFNLFPKPEKVK